MIKPKSIKKLGNNIQLVEVKKKTYSDILLEQKYFYDLGIKTYPHNSWACERASWEVQNLHKQAVTDAQRISILKNDKINQTNMYILSFNIPKTSAKIKVAYTIAKVETCIPKLLRYHNLERFWYHYEKCIKHLVCVENRTDYMDCRQSWNCTNCKQNYPADSKEWSMGKEKESQK